jgi:hypothetical protein
VLHHQDVCAAISTVCAGLGCVVSCDKCGYHRAKVLQLFLVLLRCAAVLCCAGKHPGKHPEAH